MGDNNIRLRGYRSAIAIKVKVWIKIECLYSELYVNGESPLPECIMRMDIVLSSLIRQKACKPNLPPI